LGGWILCFLSQRVLQRTRTELESTTQATSIEANSSTSLAILEAIIVISVGGIRKSTTQAASVKTNSRTGLAILEANVVISVGSI